MLQLTNKEKGILKNTVFNLYFGQKVLVNTKEKITPNSLNIGVEILGLSSKIYLELKPISNITFADANEAIILDLLLHNKRENIEVKTIKFVPSFTGTGLYYTYNNSTNILGKKIIRTGSLFFSNCKYSIIDYLRSKGYATPYIDFEVDDLITLGIVKLEPKSNEGISDFYLEKYSEIETNNSEEIELFSEQKPNNEYSLPNECVQGWETSMYCSSSIEGKCKMCK